MTTEAEILASLDPKTRKRLVFARERRVEKQPTPSIGLNRGLRGGLVYGQQSLFWGSKSSGKSSVGFQMIGKAQRAGKTCALLDAERTFDPDWAERLGVDTSKLIYDDSNHVSKVANVAVDLVSGGVDFLMIDSISAILPMSYLDGDELKNFEDTGQIGAQSRDVGKMTNMINGVNDKTLILLISQSRNVITPTYTKLKFTGGNAVEFNSSTIVKFFASEAAKSAIDGEVTVGDKIFTEQIGKPINWDVEKNKSGPEGQTGSYDFYFQGENVGIDNVSEVADYAIKFGLVEETSKGRFEIGDQKIHGLPKLKQTIREDPALFKTLTEKVYEQFG